MKLRYGKNLLPAVDGMQKISALAWSHNGSRLAVSTADRVVHLYDENGERRDKFPTKPAEKGQKSYIIRALAFSPDSTKIAVAQSDNIVFVYKLGTEWGEKNLQQIPPVLLSDMHVLAPQSR
jgi:intraflagellar transport protein 172